MKKHLAILLFAAFIAPCSLAETKVTNVEADGKADAAPACSSDGRCGMMPEVANSPLRVEDFYPDPANMRLSSCPEGQDWIQQESGNYQCGKQDEKQRRQNNESGPAQ